MANSVTPPLTLPMADIERLVRGEHDDPFRILGPHPTNDGQLAVQASLACEQLGIIEIGLI